MRICENAAQTPESLADVETGILRNVMADGLRRFEEALQSMADAEPSVGSDGRRLRRARRIGMEVDTSFGKARISVVCGQCKSTRGWETPFRDRLFRGGRGAVSPALERKVVTTVCETGSFEKAAKVCGVWGCELSDDKAMATIRRVGDACDPAMLPKLCHASQHLHALADALFPKESQKAERESWTHRLLKNLKTRGPKTLMDAIAEAEEKKIADKERRDRQARGVIRQRPRGAHELPHGEGRGRANRKRRDGVAVLSEPEPLQAARPVLVKRRLRVVP